MTNDNWSLIRFSKAVLMRTQTSKNPNTAFGAQFIVAFFSAVGMGPGTFHWYRLKACTRRVGVWQGIFMNLHCNGSMSPQKCMFEALCFAISLVLSNMAYKYLSVAFLQMIKEGILGSHWERCGCNGRCPRRQTFRNACLWELGTWTKIHVGEFLNAEFPGGF